MAQQIVIIGAGYAGMLAALRLARQTRHQAVEITLVNASEYFVERIRLHQKATRQSLGQQPIETLLRGTGVKFVQGRVSALDLAAKQVSVQTSDGDRDIPYKKLIYALGSMTDQTSVPGIGAFAYRIENADKLADEVPAVAARGGRLVIVGGGLTSIESVAEFAEAYPNLQVEFVTKGILGDDLSAAGAVYLRKVFSRLSIKLHEQTSVSAIKQAALQISNGTEIPFDLCLWTAGFVVSPLARESGLKVNARGQVLVDAYLRSVSHPDIYAVGDSALPQIPLRMAGVTAMPMGAHAADCLAAELRNRRLTPFRFGFSGRCISLGRHDGLFQIVDSGDAPSERILTGKVAVIIKEMVCRFTMLTMHMERRGIRFFYWLQPAVTPAVSHQPAIGR